MEEGDHVAVVHQPARQVADQHALGQLPVEHARRQVELRGVVELALPRVQVEVDPAEHLGGAVGMAQAHVVRRDVGMPRACLRLVDLRVGQAEQQAGDVEQAVVHLAEVEVAAHLLRVDAVLLALDRLEVVAPVGEVDRVLALGGRALEQGRDLATAGGVRLGADPVDERADRVAGADHLGLGVVVGPARVAEQGGLLVPGREQLLEDGVVLRPGEVEEAVRDLAAGHGVAREREEREQVRVLRGDRDQPVLVRRVPGDEVLGQPVERGGGHQRRTTPVADVAVERLAEVGQPLVERADPLAGLLVAVDAGPPEVAQRLVEHPLGAVVERLAVDASRAGRTRRRRGTGPCGSACTSSSICSASPITAGSGCTTDSREQAAAALRSAIPASFQTWRIASSSGVASLSAAIASPAMPELAAGAVLEPALPVVDGQGQGFRCHVPTVKVEVNPASTPRLEG